MRFLLCVDDTDDLTKSTSTGTIAELIGHAVTALGGKIEKGITRHQLLLDDAIKYTSHNSSMCFAAELEAAKLEQVKLAAASTLEAHAAAAADPGVCICNLDELKDACALIVFGLKAQKEVLTQSQAYQIATSAGGVWLKAFGGDGSGVIGALAGVGLRLCGNDGTFRGKSGRGICNITLSAREMAALLEADAVVDLTGAYLPPETPVRVAEHAKLAYVNHQKVIVTHRTRDGLFMVCDKRQMYDGDRKLGRLVHNCPEFETDNDYEECYNEVELNCYNCLYRRWSAEGFTCVKQTLAFA